MILSNKKFSTPFIMVSIFTFLALVSQFSIAFYASAVVLLSVTPLFCSAEQTLCVYMYAGCFAGCFAQNESLFQYGITYGSIILIAKLMILNFLSKNHRNKALIPLAIFYVIAVIYSLFMPKVSFPAMLRFTNFVCCIAVLYLSDNKIQLKQVIKYLLCGTLISIAFSFLYFTGLSAPKPYISGEFLRFGGCFLNVNSLGMYSSIGLACSISLWFQGKLSTKQGWFSCLAFGLAGVMSMSKTFYIITVCTLLLSYVYSAIHSQDKKKFALKSVAVLLLIAITCSIFYKFISIIVDRFVGQGVSADSITTGRAEIWKEYLKCWTKNPRTILFGCGISMPYLRLPTPRSPHSIFVGLLTQLGVVGCIALLIIIVLLIKNSGKLSKKLYCYIPLIVCILNGLTEDYLNPLHTCLPILVALLFIVEPSKTISQGENYEQDI